MGKDYTLTLREAAEFVVRDMLDVINAPHIRFERAFDVEQAAAELLGEYARMLRMALDTVTD